MFLKLSFVSHVNMISNKDIIVLCFLDEIDKSLMNLSRYFKLFIGY